MREQLLEEFGLTVSGLMSARAQVNFAVGGLAVSLHVEIPRETTLAPRRTMRRLRFYTFSP